MVSFISSSNAHHLISPVVYFLGSRPNFQSRPPAGLMVVRHYCVFGCKELRKTRTRSGVLCKGSLESEGEFALEREILEFMKKSRNPDEFPTKKELLDAGRVDLVNAIVKKGGWLSLGWDYSDDECEPEENDFHDFRDLQTKLESSVHQTVSPSERSVEMVADEDAGIEGILNRLEKHRSSFGVNIEINGYGTHGSSNDNNGLTKFNLSSDAGKSEEQGTWSGRRMYFSDTEFEAAEIDYGKKAKNREEDMEDKMLHDAQFQEINPNQITSKLKQMHLELSSSLCSLRSKSQTLGLEGRESTSSETQEVSDVWEFHENEFMRAKDKLRSLRAKIAVLEGKIALTIIDAQKLIEEKKRRIDSSRRTLQLLRTTCIFWTHPGSQVLLTGSFDGWTTQRKMEKTVTGIFSLSLKLYPGTYEIKFVVDGVWRIDPMLHVVRNNGYENNILIVT